MPRKKIYTEEFLVRMTAEEKGRIDDQARKGKVSRSRFLVVAALSGGMLPTAELLPLMEGMFELRLMALMDLRRILNRLDQIADALQQPGSFNNADLTEAINELTAAILFVREQWAEKPSLS